MLRNLYSNQVPDAPLDMDSLCVCTSLWGADCRWSDHSSISCMDGLSISSSVSCMKLLLDFRRFIGNVWPCSRCLVSFNCTLSLSRCAATLLIIAGGVIPASRHKFLILLGCKYPVMERQASLNTGLTLCACVDLSYTGHAHSAVE